MRSERFEKAYTALVNAYHGGTLRKGTCTACAVGNIINEVCPFPSKELTAIAGGLIGWGAVFMTSSSGQSIDRAEYKGLAKEQIDATGYTLDELAKIEYAFETNTRIYPCDYGITPEQFILEDQFHGLNAVMDVLLELDNISDGTKLKADLKAHPKLILARSTSKLNYPSPAL